MVQNPDDSAAQPQDDQTAISKDPYPDGWDRPRRNPWVVGAFGASSLLAGIHLGKASCRDGGSPFDCALGAFYTGVMGFSGAMLMMRDMPDPDDPGTPPERSTGGKP